MTPERKSAYRHLLYQAMLDIRIWCDATGPRSYNPVVWYRRYGSSRLAGATAYWLHNLALASAYDFEGFREDLFWKGIEHWTQRYPSAGLERYRADFDAAEKRAAS